MFILVIGLVVGILWINIGLNRPVYNTFLTYMDQSITGLNEQAPVKYNGVSVGYVQGMALNPENPQQVIVTMEIKSGTPVTTSTVATLAPQGITGLVFVSLSAQTPNAPLVKVRDKPPYPIIPSTPSLLVQLSSLFKDTSLQMAGISNAVQNVLSTENAANMRTILINLNTLTTSLAANTENMNEMIHETQTVLKNAATASAAFPEITAGLNQSITNLNQATTLAKEGMLPAVRLVQQLETISSNIVSFSSDIKQNPAILLRGKAENNLGPGE